ncbi:MAG: NUDIX domain-containing protein [Candidatus Latescibacteria bacterium]|nr:NUDIX domain-containing protein [Candidatus Latescibacterota bacterium]
MEFLDILMENGNKIGTASRKKCHDGSFLLHGVVHVLVFNDSGDILLQKRSVNKDIEPCKWDTSVGGHILSGESVHEALIRETKEELGISDTVFIEMYTFIIKSDVEREYVTTFRCVWNGPIRYPEDEIAEVSFFKHEEIESLLGSGLFTHAFETDWKKYKEWEKNT